MRPRLDDLLQAAAVEASRTVSQEIEYRLETSFHDERMALALTGSDVGALLLRMFYSAMVAEGVTPDWTRDEAEESRKVRAENFRATANAVIASALMLKIELPPPWHHQESLRLAKRLLLRSSVPMERWPNEVAYADLEPLPRELPGNDGG
jgi:hypothetical protein